MPKEERRNISKLYNKMTIGELQTMVPEIPWLEYINRVLFPFFVVSLLLRLVRLHPHIFVRRPLLSELTLLHYSLFIFPNSVTSLRNLRYTYHASFCRLVICLLPLFIFVTRVLLLETNPLC